MTDLVPSNDSTPTENVAQSLIPYFTQGGNKSRYLGYLVAGFSRPEAVKLTGVHPTTVKVWEDEDPKFVEVQEQCLTTLRHRLSDELLDIEFTRNFKLVLNKDFSILFKDSTGEVLTEKEQQYLMLIRKFYTPQQLMMVRQLFSDNGEKKEAFDFTKTVLEIRLSKEEHTTR